MLEHAFLNRDAVLIIARQPYADWANAIEHDGPRFTLTDENDSLTIFLAPEFDTTDDTERWVDKNFKYFFESQLQEWSLDKSQWPQNRTLKMFREWFTVRVHTMVVDTVDEPLEVD